MVVLSGVLLSIVPVVVVVGPAVDWSSVITVASITSNIVVVLSVVSLVVVLAAAVVGLAVE